jgi:soluble lytic murein transglycosylase-like protein
MRRAFLIGLGAVLALTAMAIVMAWLSGGPSDALWHAIVRVESGGNPRAYNRHGGAKGIAQIRGACLADINRIAREAGHAGRYTAADLFDPAKARRIWKMYLDYYGDQYAKATGRTPTDEVYARIWNGGPNGWRKASTRQYWQRVRAEMN